MNYILSPMWLWILTVLAPTYLDATTFTVHSHSQDEHTVTITIDAHDNNYVDKNSLQISVDHPEIQLEEWSSSRNYSKQFDQQRNETRTVYTTPCTLQAKLRSASNTALSQAYVHLAYYKESEKGMVHEQFPLMPSHKLEESINTALDTSGHVSTSVSLPIKTKQPEACTSWSARLSSLVETSNSMAMRILLVMLLGLLMSLTPCIYPMIPITVGILQAQGSKSLGKNLLLSLAYTMGIATTFATLGLTAALTGQLFGSLMGNPIFIITVVGVLAYLGFSMLGFYDMYTPRFMRNAKSGKGGSLTAAFLFGAASGTVASPCLSPGLILLLSIVATLGNKLIGFVLLFAFGIGLSIPLLLIGTFSTSLMLLPRAGMWMVEIKKFFGLLLFGMCFYFLNNILPLTLLLGMMTVSLLAAGIFYFQSIAPYDTKAWRTIKHISGITLIAASIFAGVQTFQSWCLTPTAQENGSIWLYEYRTAATKAHDEQKNLFVDIGASYCSICKAIDRTILSHPRVVDTLKTCVAVKIDASEEPDLIAELQQRFTIKGVPTLLLLTPQGDLIRQWGSEIYDLPIDEFLHQFKSL